jgi:hypothetical protein
MIILLALLCFLTTHNSLPILLCVIIGLTALIMIFIAGHALMTTTVGPQTAGHERNRSVATARRVGDPLTCQVHAVILSFITMVIGSASGLLIAMIDQRHVLAGNPSVIFILQVIAFTAFAVGSTHAVARCVQRLRAAAASQPSIRGALAQTAHGPQLTAIVATLATIAPYALILTAVIASVPELVGIDRTHRGPAGDFLTGAVFPLLALCLAVDMLKRLLAQRLATLNRQETSDAPRGGHHQRSAAGSSTTKRTRPLSRRVVEPPFIQESEDHAAVGPVPRGRHSA